MTKIQGRCPVSGGLWGDSLRPDGKEHAEQPPENRKLNHNEILRWPQWQRHGREQLTNRQICCRGQDRAAEAEPAARKQEKMEGEGPGRYSGGHWAQAGTGKTTSLPCTREKC